MRGSGKSAKPITVIPDIPYKKIELKLRLKEWHERDHGIELNDNLMICGLTTAIAKQELITGDRITKINGSSVKNKAEALKMLGQCGGEVKLELFRRQHTVPMSAERARKIGLQKMDGFAYFVVNCVKESKDPVSSFGFTLKLLKNRAHVIALDPKGIASIYFCLGDALLDLDGTAIPFNDLEFVRSYTLKFNKNGKFSVVVERPITPDAVNLYNLLFKCMLPQESDVDMGPDAVLIGKDAANMHRLVFHKVQPRSVYTVGSQKPNSDKTLNTRTVGNSEREKTLRVATNSMELKIASDVEDDSELKSVERKSHDKESSSFLDDFF